MWVTNTLAYYDTQNKFNCNQFYLKGEALGPYIHSKFLENHVMRKPDDFFIKILILVQIDHGWASNWWKSKKKFRLVHTFSTKFTFKLHFWSKFDDFFINLMVNYEQTQPELHVSINILMKNHKVLSLNEILAIWVNVWTKCLALYIQPLNVLFEEDSKFNFLINKWNKNQEKSKKKKKKKTWKLKKVLCLFLQLRSLLTYNNSW